MTGAARVLPRLPGERRGATSIEYAIIAMVMAAAIVAAVGAMSGDLLDLFKGVAGAFPG
ncbi:MAG: Flp family type IVb pilin [Acetobacteraceae bacterium]